MSPYQARKFFAGDSLKSLIKSIRRYGLLQPILLKNISMDVYEIISGERRFRACKLLGYEKIPAIVLDMNEKDCLCISLMENINRVDLNFLKKQRE